MEAVYLIAFYERYVTVITLKSEAFNSKTIFTVRRLSQMREAWLLQRSAVGLCLRSQKLRKPSTRRLC